MKDKHGTITKIFNTGSVTVQLSDLSEISLITSDFRKGAPRLHAHVTLGAVRRGEVIEWHPV